MIQVDTRGIRELQDGRVVVELEARQITSVRLRRGVRSERPLLELLFIVPLAAFGVMCLLAVVDGQRAKWLGLGTVTLPFAMWVAWNTYRPGPVLEVVTITGSRRLFPSSDQLEQLKTELALYPEAR